MRQITEIILHCADTPEGKEFTVNDIRRWHKARGWQDVGYHYIIYLNGKRVEGRPLWQVGAHCLHHNKHSIGICYIGGKGPDGKPKDTRTLAQKAEIYKLLRELKQKYHEATIHGHNEFAAKACPCFDVQAEYGDL